MLLVLVFGLVLLNGAGITIFGLVWLNAASTSVWFGRHRFTYLEWFG